MVKKIAQPYRKSRAPYGARGLKSLWGVTDLAAQMSRPVWGAWIEMVNIPAGNLPYKGRAPYGARGLKSLGTSTSKKLCRVAPRMGRVD